MTIEEFNKTRFHAGMKVMYNGEIYPLASANFDEKLVAYVDGYDEDDKPEFNWVRCENCEIITK